MRYRHVALIGLGLIASSISHAIRRAGMETRITGHARTGKSREEAARLGLGGVEAGEDLADRVIVEKKGHCRP